MESKMESNSSSEMGNEKMTIPGINLDDTENIEFDKGKNETEQMLGDEDRRGSEPGIIPTPMIHASFFSRYVSFW